MKLDNISEKEKREMIVNCLDKNMFVEAGAGAGKTSIIVKRIINQLMAGIKPCEIVAITFTNAATRELKGRILSEASRIAGSENAVLSKESVENLRASLDELDQMQISTIHSFCHRILTEKMFDAGLPYGFTLAEESEISELRSRYFKLWAENLKKQDWEKLLPGANYRSSVIGKIRDLVSQLDSIPEDYEIKVALPDVSEEEARALLAPIITKVCQDTVDLVNTAYGENYSTFDEISEEQLTSYGKDLRKLIDDNETIDICKKFLTLSANKSFIMKAVTNATLEEIGIKDKNARNDFKSEMAERDNEIRDYLASLRDDFEKIKAGYYNKIFRPYIGYAQDALQYIKSRSAAGIISNDELLEKTMELIKASDDVRRFFGNKFRIIYVDEFQDTDHLQESFIRLLASDPADPEKLRDGALFVVGDPKQSIYRFRGAEPEAYFSTKKRMQALDNAYVIELSDNYRSNERIIDWVNDKFSGKNITIGQGYIPMNTGKPLPQSGLPDKLFAGVFRYESPEQALATDAIGADMEAVCRLIISLIKNGYLIADRDKDDKVFYREIRYSDFLILCMYTTGMPEYAECFHRYGIPVVMDSKSDVSRDTDLLTFIRLYAYLASPMDLSAKVGALEALDMTGAASREQNERILMQMNKDTEDMSAYGCIKYLMGNPAFFMKKGEKIEDYQILDFQKKLTQMIEHIEAQDYGNRHTLLDAMREYCENKVEHELLLERDIDAVRFMNIHKAKGLEGNIVIWTNRREGRSFKEGSYRCEKTFYPSISYNADKGANTEWTAYGGDKGLINKAKQEDESEFIRLEYVAATRAKQTLVFMDRYNSKSGNMFSDGYDLASLDSVKDIIEEYSRETDCNDPSELVIRTRDEIMQEAELYADLGKALYSSESPSSYEDESAGKPKFGATSDQAHGKRPVGNIFGTVMHRAFELVVGRWNADPKDLSIDGMSLVKSCVRQAVNESIEDIPEDEVALYESFLNDAVMAFGHWFSKSDIKQGADKIYTELPFAYIKNPEEQAYTSIWMHGEADLVVKMKDDSYYIIDYKSDNDESYPDEKSFEERLRGKYSPQIEAYKEAVSRVFSTDPQKIKTALVSFSRKDLGKDEKLRLRVTTI